MPTPEHSVEARPSRFLPFTCALLVRMPTCAALVSTMTVFVTELLIPGCLVEIVVEIVAHPVRRAVGIRAVHDARATTQVPRGLVLWRHIKSSVLDPRTNGKRNLQLWAWGLPVRTWAVTSRVVTRVEIREPRSNHLDRRVARGSVCLGHRRR